jgi:hypothetical protein
MTATANLTALHAAAVSGDRFAMLVLGDLAEAGMDDARADAWRWLADPPAQGWERRAWEVLRGTAEAPHGSVRIDLGSPGRTVRADAVGAPGHLTCHLGLSSRSYVAGHGTGYYVWGRETGWRFDGDYRSRSEAPTRPPPEVREAVLSACRLALAGASS